MFIISEWGGGSESSYSGDRVSRVFVSVVIDFVINKSRYVFSSCAVNRHRVYVICLLGTSSDIVGSMNRWMRRYFAVVTRRVSISFIQKQVVQ